MPEEVKTAQLQSDPQERFNRLRSQLGVTSFGINQIVLAPGQRNRIHSHEHQEEVYLVLDGILTVTVDGTSHDLGTGELMRVAPDSRRQLINRHKRPVSLLALGGMVAHTHEVRDAVVFGDWEGPSAGRPQDTPLPGDLPDEQLVD